MFDTSGVDGDRTATCVEIVSELGFDSMSHYQYVHFVDIDRDYDAIMEDVLKEWARIDQTYAIPYFPHVSIGWDLPENHGERLIYKPSLP